MQCEQFLGILKALKAPSNVSSFIQEFYQGTQVCIRHSALSENITMIHCKQFTAARHFEGKVSW